jgi:1-acyl-sn-glycerol-3-phosphate acyltransferase
MSASTGGKPERARIVARSPFWWAVSKYLVLGVTKVWCRLRVEGRANVPASGPVLLVANHASYLDPPLVGITAGRWVAFLAQAGLGKLGPVRWWLRQMGVTLIDRNAPSKDALRLIAECLANGEAVGLFPEGTRSRDGSVAPFKNGVEFLVRRTGASVLPIGLDGACRAFPRGAIFLRPRKLIVRYGEVWPAERVLAPGGTEALRRRVAELARAPLAAAATGTGSGERSRSEPQVNPSPGPIHVDPGTKPSAKGGA